MNLLELSLVKQINLNDQINGSLFLKYLINRNILSPINKYTIQDESGNDLYIIKNKLVSWGTHYSLQNLEGEELAAISQKVLSFMPFFKISKKNVILGIVRQSFTLFGKRKRSFKLIVPGSTNYEIKASANSKTCMFIHDEEVVASSNEELFFRSNKFDLDIQQEEDNVLILSTSLVIDRVFDRTYESIHEILDPDDEED